MKTTSPAQRFCFVGILVAACLLTCPVGVAQDVESDPPPPKPQPMPPAETSELLLQVKGLLDELGRRPLPEGVSRVDDNLVVFTKRPLHQHPAGER